MLELTNATYRYAGYARPVLHDVSLAIGTGELIVEPIDLNRQRHMN